MSQVTTGKPNAGALRVKAAASFIGVAESTFWRWVAQGRLPRGKRLSARATVWMRSDLEQFLEEA